MPVPQHLPELQLSISPPCAAAPTMLKPGLAGLLPGPTALPSSRARGLGQAGSTTPHRWAPLGTAGHRRAPQLPLPAQPLRQVLLLSCGLLPCPEAPTAARPFWNAQEPPGACSLAVQAPCKPCSPLHPTSADCTWQETRSICREVLGSTAPERPASRAPTPTGAESIC